MLTFVIRREKLTRNAGYRVRYRFNGKRRREGVELRLEDGRIRERASLDMATTSNATSPAMEVVAQVPSVSALPATSAGSATACTSVSVPGQTFTSTP